MFFLDKFMCSWDCLHKFPTVLSSREDGEQDGEVGEMEGCSQIEPHSPPPVTDLDKQGNPWSLALVPALAPALVPAPVLYLSPGPDSRPR